MLSFSAVLQKGGVEGRGGKGTGRGREDQAGGMPTCVAVEAGHEAHVAELAHEFCKALLLFDRQNP